MIAVASRQTIAAEKNYDPRELEVGAGYDVSRADEGERRRARALGAPTSSCRRFSTTQFGRRTSIRLQGGVFALYV